MASGGGSPSLLPDDGQERVMAAAKHIVKSLAVSKNAADDMIRFLSTYDPRLLSLSSPETGEDASGSGSVGDEEKVEIAAAEDVIHWCNSSSSSSGMIIDYLYLEAVDAAIAAAPHSARAAAVVHAAMPRLEEEVRSLLCSSRRRLSLSSDDLGDATPDASPSHGALSPRAAESVQRLTSRMLRAGYGPELAQAYVAVRRDALAESVAHLGVDAVSIEEVLKMDWPVLDLKMRRWNHAVRAVVRTFLDGERELCDKVFMSDEELGRECFADVARGCILQLLGFADAVAMSTRAIEKLYRTIAMYEALTDIQPELDALFAGDEYFSAEVAGAVASLGSTVRQTIEEFMHAIDADASRAPVHGEIHPMTRYVLNYCVLLADCRSTLDTVLGYSSLGATAEAPTDGVAAATTPSARCMRGLLTLLLRKIDDKSRLYDDAGLQNIFLMSNVHYTVQKVMELPPLRELLGDDWLRRHRGQVRQYEALYLRASWYGVLSRLSARDDGAGARRAPATGPSARSFNEAFAELYRTQTSWKVSDPQVREELRIAVSERLIPAYRGFLAGAGRHPARHVRHSLEDLEKYMLDFFEGAQKFVRW